jgi:hypothetical protein
MIGPGGLTLIGKWAAKQQKGAPWEIKGAKQSGFPPKWQYTLDMRGLMQMTVAEDDSDWALITPKVDPQELELQNFIAARLAPDIKGDVNGWAVADENRFKISPCIKMDAGVFSDDETKYLWSGGAADCVIVGAHSVLQKRGYVMHTTRNTAADAGEQLMSLETDRKVYLASKYFSYGALQAAQAGTVQQVVAALKAKGIDIVNCYGSGRLAVNSVTGEILTEFCNPQL